MKLNLFIPLVILVGFAGSLVNAAEVGSPAPQFTLPSLQQNQRAALIQFAGKVVYLDFWASWCAPCRTSFPLLDGLYQKLKSRGFEVVAVNLDEEKENAEKFLEHYPVNFTVLRDSEGHWADQYGVESMPTSFIVDKKGVIQHVHNGFSKYDIDEIEKIIVALLDKQ